ncbi:HpcH/HpaI aldolase/citrate lyase family protein [Raineyella antarctica]|uniref:HpcH/HpaI aldolase/citrate lyase family protein n=1 Tax=Raineyella antarctica TaxID=1577474 RepID=UPI000B844499|nr:CoA ester lyase [Raineyella antarctica]
MPAIRRTVLAVPGSSDRFLTKGLGLGVDAVFLDLEDAVAPPAKAEARGRIVEYLHKDWAAPTVTVRVNDWTTQWTYADVIEVVAGAGDRIDALVLPKVQGPDHIRALDLLLTQVERTHGLPVGRIGIEAQVEDARGLLNADAIAGASARMRSLVYGPGDFAASMGMPSLNVGAQPAGYEIADAYHHVLMTILVAARAHGIAAIDGPYVAIRDVEGFTAAARRVAALGYDGKWVLHPAQVEAGNAAFTPDRAAYDRAERIMARYAEATSQAGGAVGAIVVDDEMVDEAGMKLAATVAARGRAAGMSPTQEED